MPLDELEAKVLAEAEKIAKIEPMLVQINKRVVHRQMEVMGVRTGIRVGTELCALGTMTPALDAFLSKASDKGLTKALDDRDDEFGDYRTADAQPDQPQVG